MIAAIPNCRTSVANALEALIVVERRGGAESGAGLDAILEAQASSWSRGPVTLEQLSAARRARRRFGNGNHSAALNFGDCFAYPLGAATGEPLLYKGNDFARTDIAAALPSDGALRQ